MHDRLPDLMHALAFAADRHRSQPRKDELKTPYMNHVIDVVRLLVDHGVRDYATLAAAALHDTVEDTDTTPEELERHFGAEVRALVAEMTDDKHLPKADRKRLQIEHAPGVSAKAALIKLADKISNAKDVGHRPAANWSAERRLEYLAWAAQVVERLPAVSPSLRQLFADVHREGVHLVNGGEPDAGNGGGANRE